jgi:hypothetical protein
LPLPSLFFFKKPQQKRMSSPKPHNPNKPNEIELAF